MSIEKPVKILAVESSCDETAAAVIKDGREIMSNIISSQIDLHTLYGGVVPELASRKHIEKIDQVVTASLKEAGETLSSIDAVAVTYGPGLVGALLVGVGYAKALAWAADKPLIGVNHIEGHIAANYIEHKELEPPFLCLIISGGHTHLVHIPSFGEYVILGRSRDDAAGEAYDKVARSIGLGYPGGPKIEKAAREGNPSAISFPRPGFDDAPYDFSFSGLKSAVLNYLNECSMKGITYDRNDVAASFQAAVVDTFTERVERALDETKEKSFALAGGVASNGAIREALRGVCEKKGVNFYVPSPILCTDNAAMIGAAGYIEYIEGRTAKLSLNGVPALKIGER